MVYVRTVGFSVHVLVHVLLCTIYAKICIYAHVYALSLLNIRDIIAAAVPLLIIGGTWLYFSRVWLCKRMLMQLDVVSYALYVFHVFHVLHVFSVLFSIQ
jgi:hypothetical protein